LSKALLHTTDVPTIIESAAAGNLANVDLRIADLPAADLANLPAHATAPNFGRLADRARPGDYALGILNLVLQTVGAGPGAVRRLRRAVPKYATALGAALSL